MNAFQVSSALRKRYSDSRRYAVAEEVGITTGAAHRRIDMIVVDCYYSNGFRIDGFEIKVSTADLRRELADPEKHVAFFDMIDFFTLACPAETVKPVMDIIPKKWGIIIVNEDGTTRYKRRPLALRDELNNRSVPRGFFASCVRAIQARQPSQQELDTAFENGLKEGESRAKKMWSFEKERVQRNLDKLEKYEQLMMRFRIYGDDIDKIMDEFETFRRMDPIAALRIVDRTINQLDTMKQFFETNEPPA